MVRLRSVDVVSCAKTYGILHVAFGVLVALVLVLIGLVGFAAAPANRSLARSACWSSRRFRHFSTDSLVSSLAR